jgi:hypothetical protein
MKNRTKTTMIIATTILFSALLIVAVVIMNKNIEVNNSGVLEPDYEHISLDSNAQTIPEETVDEPANNSQGGGSMKLVYSDKVFVDLKNLKVGLYYQNPSSSSHSIVVQIIIARGDEQYLVAESGGIDPGYMLTEMKLNKDIKLSEGIYKGIMKLWFFDPETGDRAVVDTNIPVEITAK